MKRRTEPKFDDEAGPHALPQDLARTLEKVGPKQYGYATARKFAPGGEYAKPRRTKQRTALT